MQMAKTSAVLAVFMKWVVVHLLLADPTTGGSRHRLLLVMSFWLTSALIGFAGPRVIEQTIVEVAGRLPPRILAGLWVR